MIEKLWSDMTEEEWKKEKERIRKIQERHFREVRTRSKDLK